MARQRIVIANIKMNLSVPETTVLFEKYIQEIKPQRAEVVVCPSYLDIYSAEKLFQPTPIKIGAQDVFYEDEGQYTGEVSPEQLKGFVDYVIVGHSERRKNFGETDKIVAKKAAAAIKHDITPIICVGENLHEKMDGLTKLVVVGQLEASLAELTTEEVGKVIIAYEPVWATGTGQVCEPDVANTVAGNLRNLVKALYGQKAAERVHIVYGGSLDEDNIGDFLSKKEIDGFLVGSAALDHAKFAKLVAKVDEGYYSASKSQATSNKQKETKKRQKATKKSN